MTIISERKAVVNEAVTEDTPLQFLWTTDGYIVNGKISQAIYPCRGCGELIDMSREVCNCFGAPVDVHSKEGRELVWRLTLELAHRNREIILSGAPFIFGEILSHLPFAHEEQREAIAAQFTTRAQPVDGATAD